MLQALGILAAGCAAGALNVVVGSGTLITFPVLLAFGYAPVVANVSNTIGLVPGSVAGAFGYRRELVGQRGRMLVLLPFTVVGAAAGAALLLTTPARAFEKVVPVLIVLACALLLAQRHVARLLEGRHGSRTTLLRAGVLVTAVYGGYFGAAVSVVVIALLAITIDDSFRRLNAIKVPLAGVMNLVSGIAFAIFAPVHWGYALVLAPSTLVGGRIGAAAGRRVPDQPLRLAVVVLGVVAAVWLEFSR